MINVCMACIFSFICFSSIGKFIYIFFISLLEYKCFPMLCQFLLYNKVNQLYVYIYLHIPILLSLPSTLHIPSLQVLTKHQVDLLVLCSNFPLVIHFTFGSVYMSMLLCHFIPASPYHPVPSSPFSMSVSLFLLCHQVHQYCFLKFHIYLLACCIYFSLSDFLHCMTDSRSIHLTIDNSISFLFMAE